MNWTDEFIQFELDQWELDWWIRLDCNPNDPNDNVVIKLHSN